MDFVPARPVRRGLRLLLPPSWGTSVVARVEAFAGLKSLLGRVVRLCVRGVLLDGYVVDEGATAVDVRLVGGAILRVPRCELGAMVWDVARDTNPNNPTSLTAAWVHAALEIGEGRVQGSRSIERAKGVAAIEMHLNSSTPCRSHHRRLRCYAPGESKERPFGPPKLVYVKMTCGFEAVDWGGRQVVARADSRGPTPPAIVTAQHRREVAAYSILPMCSPACAPTCHYASVHDETESFAIVLDDLSTLPHPSVPMDVAGLRRVVGALAALHGRFMEPSINAEVEGPSGKDLRKAMAHSAIYYAAMQNDLEESEDEAYHLQILSQAYGREPVAAECFFPPPVTDHVDMESVAMTKEEKYAFAHPPPTIRSSSLSLIHGQVESLHVKVNPAVRLMPNVFLIDWGCSGVGPVEIDLIQLFVRLAAPSLWQSKEAVLDVLGEYAALLRILYKVERHVVYLMQSMRDIAAVLMCSPQNPWSGGADMKQDLSRFHRCLLEWTTPAQLNILLNAMGP